MYALRVYKCLTNYQYLLQLVAGALNQLTCGAPFCSVDGNRSLTDRICTLHVVHEMHKSELLWFGQLTQQVPSVVRTMPFDNSTEKMVGI